VVQLFSQVGTAPTGVLCTGTFIAKNWIATAAHCLVVIDQNAFANAGSAVQVYNGEASKVTYFVTHFDENGNAIPNPDLFTNIVQYVNPGYIHFKDESSFENDFALLFIPDTEDGRLAPDPDGPQPGQGPWMRIAVSGHGVPSLSSEAWGAGLVPNRNTLNRADFGLAAPFTESGTLLFGTASPMGPLICGGDSGGPVVDTVSIPGDPALSEPVMVTTHQGFLFDVDECPPPPGKLSPECACGGSQLNEVRTDLQMNFIQNSMREWNGVNFACNQVLTTRGRTVAECWGQKCQSNQDCPTGKTCSIDGVNLTGCTVCPRGGCGCIFGQCLPAFDPETN
jgi:hypothetical protein